MAGRARFQTLKKNEHRRGRLAVSFTLTQTQLSVNLLAARNLAVQTEGLRSRVHFRVQIMPFADQEMVAKFLFSARTPATSAFRKHTESHCNTSSPALEAVSFGWDRA